MLLAVAVLIACAADGGDSAPSGETDADTDTDTDSDSDTDADTDSDSDTDADWTSIEGTVTYDWRVNGESLCDATVQFTGVPYTGLCPECDFLFEVEGTLTNDDGNGACPFLGPLSIYNNTAFYAKPLLLGFAPELVFKGASYYDALVVGITYALPGTPLYGPYIQPLTGGASKDYGSATYTDGLLDWSVSQTKAGSYFEFVLYPYYYAPCTFDLASEAAAPYAPGNTTYGTLPCTEGYVDVFSFRGAAAGTAYVTFDATSEDVPLETKMWVYGPDSCVERTAYDNFDCANGAGGCPAMAVPTEDASYLLVVGQVAPCDKGAGEPGDYRLDIDAAWDPNITVVRDDLQNVGKSTLEIAGSATLSK